MIDAICYFRVSTNKQGVSGLGLDAQREAVQKFAKSNELMILAEYTEIESGRNNKRPILYRAIEKCKQKQAILLIAKLDRLGRNLAFISSLIESDISFIAVDNPHANKFILHILGAFAEHERDQISLRTKSALMQAKLRGVQLGTNAKVLAKKNKARAIAFAKQMKPMIEELNNNGHDTVRSIVSELNRLKIKTVTGKGRWHVHTVYRLLQQIKKLK